MTGRSPIARETTSRWLRATLLLGIAACGGPQKLGDAGATCFRDDDCQAGFVCVAPTADDIHRVCSSDPSPLISMVKGPDYGGAGGTGGTGGTGGAGGASGAATAGSAGQATAGVATGGASGGMAGMTSAGGGGMAGSVSAGTDAGGTDSAGTSGSAGAPTDGGAPP